MFGNLILSHENEVALGLINETRGVSHVCFYADTRMLSVTTETAEEIFMAFEIDPSLALPMKDNKVIHIAHINSDQLLEREYSVALLIA